MNNINRSNRARISALILSFTVTFVIVVAMTTASEHPARPRALSVDGPAARVGTATGSGIPAVPPGALSDDPELMRIDRGSEHHG